MADFYGYKQKIEEEITEELTRRYEEKKLTDNDARIIARFILANIDKIHSGKDLLKFLRELSGKWPIFTNIYEIEQGKLERIMETEAAHQVVQLVKTGKVKQALHTARKAMEGK